MARYVRFAPLFVAAAAIAVAIPATVFAEPTTPTTTTTQTTPTTTTTQSPKALGSNVVLEITGSGTVYSIDIDPGGRVATENSAVPFRTSIAAEPGTLVQIIAVTKTGESGLPDHRRRHRGGQSRRR